MIIEDLPSGSIFVFVANLFTSFLFQFVGFLLTYLLHTTHAAKFGSRAGLGLTLIQYGFYSRAGDSGFGVPNENVSGIRRVSERSFLATGSASAEHPPADGVFLNVASREWLSFLLMTLGTYWRIILRHTMLIYCPPLGWFLLLSSLFGFWRIKHWEASIRASQARAPPTAQEIERDIVTRRTLENVFHLSGLDDNDLIQDEMRIPTRHELDEARLRRDLQNAGLL